MTRTAALTGASGFIGSVILRQMEAAGWRVRILVRPPTARANLAGTKAEFNPGDLADGESLEHLVRGARAVVHCAGAVRGAFRDAFDRVNVDGVAAIVKAATGQDTAPRFLLISSLAARHPELSFYAASKRRGEKVLAETAGAMPWAAFRPAAVYGPGDKEMLPVFRWIMRGVAPVLGDGRRRFSLLYVEDLAAAVLKWLELENPPAGVFELHDGNPGGYSWHEVIDAVSRMRGGRVLRLPIPTVVGMAVAGANQFAARRLNYAPMLTPGKIRELTYPDWVCDNEAYSRQAGWRPRVSLEEGLRRSLALEA